jgi:hypothetical protein
LPFQAKLGQTQASKTDLRDVPHEKASVAASIGLRL